MFQRNNGQRLGKSGGQGRKLWWAGILGLAVGVGLLVIHISQEVQPTPGVDIYPFQAEVIENQSIHFEAALLKQEVSGADYFVNYRIKRDQFRQETKVMLAELLDSTVVESQKEAQAKWLALSSKILQEEELENLLRMKGFRDVVADVLPDTVSVIVYTPDSGLTDSEVTAIQNTAAKVTRVRAEKVGVLYRT